MPTLKDIEEILNPADPTLKGLLPVGTTVAGGITNLVGQGNATSHQVAGVDEAMKTVNDAGAAIPGIVDSTLNAQKDLYNPYISAGTGALGQINAGLKPGGGLADDFKYDTNDFLNDPARKFALEEGIKQNRASLGAQGIDYSGGAARQLDKYAQGVNDQFFNQDYARSEKTFRDNQQSRLKALEDLTGTGLTASTNLANATGHAGDAKIQGQEWTASEISQLQQAKADALAAGDLSKVTAINDTLKSIAGQISDSGALKKIVDAIRSGGIPVNDPLKGADPNSTAPTFDDNGPTYGDLTGPAAVGTLGTVAGLTPETAPAETLPPGHADVSEPYQIPDETASAEPQPAEIPAEQPPASVTAPIADPGTGISPAVPGALTAVGATLGLGSLLGSTAPELAAVVPGLTGLGTAAAVGSPALAAGLGAGVEGGLVTGTIPGEALAPAITSSGSLGSTMIGFLSNPITIGVGAGILAITALLKSQAHWEANDMTKNIQGPFGDHLGTIVDGFDTALASGQLDKATAQQMRDQTAQVINDFNQAVTDFSKKGDDKKKVALQAMQTMADRFGARADYPNLPSYDKILGKMDREIAQLPDPAQVARPIYNQAPVAAEPASMDARTMSPEEIAAANPQQQQPALTPEQLALMDPSAMSLEDRLRLWMGGNL